MTESLLHRPTVYGARAKLGVIVPPTNTANEAEWQAMAPAGVSIHAARMPLHTDTDSDQGRAALCSDIVRYAADLAPASVDVIAYGCTAGSMLEPITALAELITETTGVKSITTSQAIVQALGHLGIERLAIATPYHEALNAHEARFLGGHGFEVLAIEGLGYGANGPEEYRNIARIQPRVVSELAKRVNRNAAQALLLSCTDMASLAIIEALESELQKPVISSNTATFWAALRQAGINDALSGFGQLLQCSTATA